VDSELVSSASTALRLADPQPAPDDDQVAQHELAVLDAVALGSHPAAV